MLTFVHNLILGLLLNLFTVLCFVGLHEVARELENPFQNVPNDLPLNNYQAQFNESLMIMFYGYHPDGHNWTPPPQEEEGREETNADAENSCRQFPWDRQANDTGGNNDTRLSDRQVNDNGGNRERRFSWDRPLNDAGMDAELGRPESPKPRLGRHKKNSTPFNIPEIVLEEGGDQSVLSWESGDVVQFW